MKHKAHLWLKRNLTKNEMDQIYLDDTEKVLQVDLPSNKNLQTTSSIAPLAKEDKENQISEEQWLLQ